MQQIKACSVEYISNTLCKINIDHFKSFKTCISAIGSKLSSGKNKQGMYMKK